MSGSNLCHDGIRSLALGPDSRVSRYTGCMVNGYRFHTQSREKDRKTQNSGVVVKGDHGNNTVDFYGTLQDIIEVEYLVGKQKVLLFKCDWWESKDKSGVLVDKESRLISVNLCKKWYVDQPYILAYQAHQIFYLQDLELRKSWHVVQSFSPRNAYDVSQQDDELLGEDVYQEEEPEMIEVVDLNIEVQPLARGTLPLRLIDPSSSVTDSRTKPRETPIERDSFFIDDDDIDMDNTIDDKDDEDIWPTDHNDSE